MASLLQCVARRFDDEDGRESVTRLLYVGTVPKASKTMLQALCTYHESFLKDIDADVSGLMVLQADTFLNLIEATPEVVIALLKHLDAEASRPGGIIENLRVVACAEDCPTHCFTSWSFRPVALAAEKAPDLDAEDVATASYDMYSKLVKLGHQLSDAELSVVDHSAALDNLKLRYAAFLPSNERVRAFATTKSVTSVKEFIAMFDGPLDAKPTGDEVWPIPQMFPY